MEKRPSKFDKLINNKYIIKVKVKTGGFGSVYLAKDIKDDKKQYAIKIIPKKYKRYSDIEFKLYQLFQENKFTTGFVKNYQTGEYQNSRYLVMELLGEDLEDYLFRSKDRKLTVKTVLMVALQVIDRIQALHKIGYLHRDIKPDNLLMGKKQKNKIIYLIDFGLAKQVKQPRSKDEEGKAVGTLAYMSINSHLARQQTLANDLQSFIYTLLYLIVGTLPWMKINIQKPSDIHKVQLMKQKLKKQDIKAAPKQLFEILDYIKGIKKDQIPDYLKIKYKLLQALKNINEENDFNFDWCYNNSKRYTPRKQNNIIEEMKEDNQKLVQREIYEVYRFIAHEEPQKQIHKKQVLNLQNKKLKRPMSTNIKPQKLQQKKNRKLSPNTKIKKSNNQQLINLQTKDYWLDKLQKLNVNQYQGPKIVINKTAKHKI